MAKAVERRKGTATEHASFTGNDAEITVNTTNKSVHVHDGATAGGFELARVDLSNTDLTATITELNYVDGVTSAIQTQLNAKANLSGANFTGNVDVTGTVTADGLTVDGDIALTAGDKVKFNDDRYFTPENNIDGAEVSANGNFTVKTGATPNKSLVVGANGDVSFYEDTGTTAKMVWDASAERLGLGTANPDGQLDVRGGGVTDVIVRSTSANSTSRVLLQNDARVYSTKINTDDTFRIKDETADADRLTIDTSGNVGIGTSPSADLHINNTSGSELRIDTIGGSNVNSVLNFRENGIDRASLYWNGDANKLYLETTFGDVALMPTGNVGIGTSSPSQNLHINGQAENVHLMLTNSTTGSTSNDGFHLITETGTGNAYIIQRENANLITYTNNTERMRLDSSGNLLVGKTSTNFNTEGFNYEAGAALEITTDSNRVMRLNRTANDGNILEFNKDGSTVGSIGVAESGDRFYLSGKVRGVALDDSDDCFMPCGNTGVGNDGIVNLGKSNSRFKDLYLSGGVYLGGTGSANKLDDYEEGTWTGTIGGSTSNPTTEVSVAGRYVKVGAIVTVQIQFNNYSNVGASGEIRINGLPFVNEHDAVGSGWSGRATSSDILCKIDNTTSSIRFLNGSGNAQNWSSTGTGTYTGATITYRTTA